MLEGGVMKDEAERSCDRILNMLREMEPRISTNLTKQFTGPSFAGMNPGARKFRKVTRLASDNETLFRSIVEKLAQQAGSAGTAVETSSLARFLEVMPKLRSGTLENHHEVTGGNFKKL